MNTHSAAHVVNISRFGALVRAPSPQPLHADVTLWVELPDRIVEFRGQVVRCTTAAGPAPIVDIGIQFVRGAVPYTAE